MNSSNSQIELQGAEGSPLDLYAAALSTLCLIHCLALPLLATMLPLAAHFAESELAHRVLVLLAAPVSLWVVWKAWPIEGSGLFIGAALTGLGLLLLGAFVAAVEVYEEPITVAGSLLLGSAHLWRWLRHRGRRE
ncbi:MAG: MerC domain-containing protein [Pseudomonadota bacterium]